MAIQEETRRTGPICRGRSIPGTIRGIGQSTEVEERGRGRTGGGGSNAAHRERERWVCQGRPLILGLFACK